MNHLLYRFIDLLSSQDAADVVRKMTQLIPQILNQENKIKSSFLRSTMQSSLKAMSPVALRTAVARLSHLARGTPHADELHRDFTCTSAIARMYIRESPVIPLRIGNNNRIYAPR